MRDRLEGLVEGVGGLVGVNRLDHVAVAVRDAQQAVDLYVGALGAEFVMGGDNDETGNRILHFRLGGFKLEVMQPLRPDALLAPFVENRGEGFHHLTFVVDDLPAAIDALDRAGLATTGTDLTNPIWRETFIRPRDAGGALVQLVTTTRDWSHTVDAIALDDVLAGRVHFREAWPCWRDGVGSPA